MLPGASRMAERPSISTHVLDTDRGAPARGVRVELYRQGRLLSDQQTNDDGRIADLVQGTLEAGRYRMVFHVELDFQPRKERRWHVKDHPVPAGLQGSLNEIGRYRMVFVVACPVFCGLVVES